MPLFTCIAEVPDTESPDLGARAVWVTQHTAESPDRALREAIGKLPYADGDPRGDDELTWLEGLARGNGKLELTSVGWCKNVWAWVDGRQFDSLYSIYVVQTHSGPDA